MSKLIDIPEGTDIIDVKKKMNRMLSVARNESKPTTCILCGKPKTSFCNSHSVPQLALKNVADKGMLLLASSLIGIEVVDYEKGVNNSCTFHYICNDCDSSFFQDYENENNLQERPTDKMLAEIAVKNFLLQLSKRAQEKALYKNMQEKTGFLTNPEDLFEIKKLDVRDYTEELFFHKDIADTEKQGGYQILFWKVLPYTIPIAMQSAVALAKDMEGNSINDVFDMSKNVRMQFLQIAILPLNGKSVVLAFYHKRDKLYKRLWHQFNCSSEEKCLSFLNHLIFEYTENYFISPSIRDEIENNTNLSALSQENNGFPGMGFVSEFDLLNNSYQSIGEKEIPNFLTKEWKVI